MIKYGTVIDLIGGVRATVWLSLALLLAIATGVQSCRLDNAQDGGKLLTDANAKWQEADHNNRIAIGNFKTANERWAARDAANRQASADALASLAKEYTALSEQAKRTTEALEKYCEKNPKACSRGIAAGLSDILLRDGLPKDKNRNR